MMNNFNNLGANSYVKMRILLSRLILIYLGGFMGLDLEDIWTVSLAPQAVSFFSKITTHAKQFAHLGNLTQILLYNSVPHLAPI